MSRSIPISGLYCVAKDLSWVCQAGCNTDTIVAGTFVMVPGRDEKTAIEAAKVRIGLIEWNAEQTRKVLGHD